MRTTTKSTSPAVWPRAGSALLAIGVLPWLTGGHATSQETAPIPTESGAAESGPAESGPDARDEGPTIVVVVGAGGQAEYERQFSTWADRWQTAARAGGAAYIEIGRDRADGKRVDGKRADHKRLKATLAEQAEVSGSPMWLVLIGHGTFYRDVARFNLRGPDVSARQLAAMLAPIDRPLVLINCASSSGPFLQRLAGDNRTIITSTRSGSEQNFSRFGDFLSSALNDSQSDLDHDNQVSLLEAFLAASAGVRGFYRAESRLATEHALLDDNGDGLGTPADFFRGARAVRAARDGATRDGLRARRQHLIAGATEMLTPQQRARRNELEDQIEQLRARKSQESEDAYYQQLEALLLPLAQIYRESAKVSRKR